MRTEMKVEYIDHLGSDLTVVNAARVSFDKTSDWDPEKTKNHPQGSRQLTDADEKLISYLARNNHWTPFSHCQITLREKVPIFVARQRFKHMVGFTYNEVSRRYVDDDPEFYTPDVWRSRPDGSAKQGSGAEIVGRTKDVHVPTFYDDIYYSELIGLCSTFYTGLIKKGVAPEQARMVLPQSMYTEYYVTGSLAAWARAYKLRIDPHSQKEIQELAKQWDQFMRIIYPVSWSALVD